MSATEALTCRTDSGETYAGQHLLIDVWQGQGLTDIDAIEAMLREAIAACGATLLNLHLHPFSGHGGVSGVAVLAESHMSIHTWPEHQYAALDIFVCGGCDPAAAVAVIEKHMQPERIEVRTAYRGRLEGEAGGSL